MACCTSKMLTCLILLDSFIQYLLKLYQGDHFSLKKLGLTLQKSSELNSLLFV